MRNHEPTRRAAHGVETDDEVFYRELFGRTSRPYVHNDEFFVVVPTRGALQDDHLLVCAKGAHTGLFDMTDAELGRLEQILFALENLYSSCYNQNFIIFENGTRYGGASGCSIRHHHAHVVPVGPEFTVSQITYWEKFKPVFTLREARQAASGLGDYLLIRRPGEAMMIGPRKQLPSQFMRKVVADSLGQAAWDWRSDEFKEDFLDAERVEKIARRFQNMLFAHVRH